LEKHRDSSATLHFNSKITSDNRSWKGVHPIAAHESHQKNLAKLVDEALRSLPVQATADFENTVLVKGKNGTEIRKKPDFVTATRGPGMRASLITGIDTAKGLAVAWQVPFLGVNHMQAHAVTPRLVSALDSAGTYSNSILQNPPSEHGAGNRKDYEHIGKFDLRKANPSFPFLSLLVSGGHTMLVHSKGLCDHEILTETTDLAIGDLIDKCARDILPAEVLNSSGSVMYGPALERYAFPGSGSSDFDYCYTPHHTLKGIKGIKRPTPSNPPVEHDWTLNHPLSSPAPGVTPEEFAARLSFSGIGSHVKRIAEKRPEMKNAERQLLAREVMRVAFEHVGSRILMALDNLFKRGVLIANLVVAGGVASNQYLKHILRVLLDSRGYNNTCLVFPPPKFCTDNAAMIAWAGIEMWEAGYRTELTGMALREWTIDPKSSDGGILGADGWIKEVP
jgi:N6-L-threonylcarbamoyladenine synthase